MGHSLDSKQAVMETPQHYTRRIYCILRWHFRYMAHIVR